MPKAEFSVRDWHTINNVYPRMNNYNNPPLEEETMF